MNVKSYIHLNHHKTMSSETVRIHIEHIRRTLASSTRTEDTSFSIVPSRVDRAKFGGSDWNAWSDSVVRRYNACIELDINVGRATADVVCKMLLANKPVFLYQYRGTTKPGFLQRVVRVIPINPNDWQNGWTLQVRE